MKRIRNALISVYYKKGLDSILKKLQQLGTNIYSTGGTYEFIKDLGIPVNTIESLTSYPSILGGRVKTLHPKVFGGILSRRENNNDKKELDNYKIPEIDLVIVNLYPFEETLKQTNDEQEIIEKIDIGGISLIRAAAKNYKDVLVISSPNSYEELLTLLDEKNGYSSMEDRKYFATKAFNVSSGYDTAIFNHFNKENLVKSFKTSISGCRKLRYGENPHQEGFYYGDLNSVFEQLHGKEISHNNILDLDAAVNLISEFDETTFAILKHNNACGLSSRPRLINAWKDALAGDPISAFGGVLISNHTINNETADEINKLFFEIILAPDFETEALEILKKKKNRIILKEGSFSFKGLSFRSVLNGVLVQSRDIKTETIEDLKTVTNKESDHREKTDLIFANKIVKHTKSNAIVLAKNKQLIASGTGQTSRVDALKQAIDKARNFKLNLDGAVMASDAFFPFADSVEIANKAGITAVIQPGGSIRDQDSIDYCNEHNLSMVFTSIRHFKH